MKLIFSFWLISPAHAQSGASEETGGVLLLLVICGVILYLVFTRRRKRVEENEENQTARERAQLIRDQPPITIREYKGKQEQATKHFQRDAADLATLGYFPTNQSWAPTRRPIRTILLFGLIFTQPTGALTVTYERRKVSVEDEEKTCPQCAERVKAAALVCRFCGYQFPSEKVLPLRQDRPQ